MSQFIVHSVPGSPFGRAVLASLEEKVAPRASFLSQTPEWAALTAPHPDLLVSRWQTKRFCRKAETALVEPSPCRCDE